MELIQCKYFVLKYFEKDKSFSFKSRLAIGLVSRGCNIAQDNKPCIYCTYLKNNVGISLYFEEFKKYLTQLSNSSNFNIDVVSLHTLGSFLDQNEVTRHEGENIINHIFKIFKPSILTIESHPKFITKHSINWLNSLKLKSVLEVGLGFDTVSDYVRNKIIGKKISKKMFKDAINTLLQSDINPVPFVVFNPPGLNIVDAISEAEETVKYLSSVGVKIAWFEPVKILEGSEIETLYNNGNYKLASNDDFIKCYKICRKNLDLRMGGNIESKELIEII